MRSQREAHDPKGLSASQSLRRRKRGSKLRRRRAAPGIAQRIVHKVAQQFRGQHRQPAGQHQLLDRIGIRAGRYALYVPEALKPRAMALRAQLWSLLRGIETPKLPSGGLIAVAPPADWPRGRLDPPDICLIYANPAFERLTGYARPAAAANS